MPPLTYNEVTGGLRPMTRAEADAYIRRRHAERALADLEARRRYWAALEPPAMKRRKRPNPSVATAAKPRGPRQTLYGDADHAGALVFEAETT